MDSSRKCGTCVKKKKFKAMPKNYWGKVKFNNKSKNYFVALIATLVHFNMLNNESDFIISK
jgi:hypothetical protein